MRAGRIGVTLWTLLFIPALAVAQYQPPSEKFTVTVDRATTWSDRDTTIVLIDNPVTIETDRAILTARQAVIWLSPVPGAVFEQQQAEIAMIGDAQVKQTDNQVVRSGDQLFVTANIRGAVRIVAENRISQNQADSNLYRAASTLRPSGGGEVSPGGLSLIQNVWRPDVLSTQPTTLPATMPRPKEPVTFRAANVQTISTPEDRVAFVLSGQVTIYQRRANGDFIELLSERAVVFTKLRRLGELAEGGDVRSAEDAVEAAYLEGDVRINFTPSEARKSEQRLNAERVYYEFGTDRAVLTQAVIQTTDPAEQIPIVVRADVIRQLSANEFTAEGVELSTSRFRTPSYSVRSGTAYIRQSDTNDERYGNRTQFKATDSTFTLFGVPWFYMPQTAGSMTDRGSALRQLLLGADGHMGFGVRSEWGLFESFGQLPPDGLDVGYRLDYFTDRGPATGFDVNYSGGYVTETTREPWDFKGRLTSYLINDHGEDDLGRDRRDVEPEDDTRGRLLWEHQHFFPSDWQIQLRGGFATDPTFLQEFFQREFDEGMPHDVTAYLKRQRDTEAITLLLQFQPNDYPTSSNELQEQVAVQRLPEFGYHRIGDSFWNDGFTFFSDNSLAALQFNESNESLFDQGFAPGQSPGIPSFGQTGTNDDTTYRADLRQQIDYPANWGQFRVVPYVMGRYIGYSDSPDGGSLNRILAGMGVKVSTAFWQVDNSARSDLFDVYRIRHVIEPEMHLFASAQTEDRTDAFIYDEQIDAVNDVLGGQIALRQRWQTKRGGPGRRRSVDLLTLNIEGNFFANTPDDVINQPRGFRGLYFYSLPEASIPRNSINADALWCASDSTAVLADVQWNLDELSLATTSIGLAAQRDPRLSYFIGARYIGQINSTIATIAGSYELSAKYAVQFTQSWDLSERRNQDTSVTVVRRFDRLLGTLTLYYDAVDDTSGFNVGLIPEGLGFGISSQQFETAFGQQ